MTQRLYPPNRWERRRAWWRAATLLAKIVLLSLTIVIVIGAPVAVFRLADFADWSPGFWPGLAAGLILAFALWWSWLILYDD